MTIPSLPYRSGVGIMLLNANKEVFIAKRLDGISDAWQMPQGGIDAGETPEAAAMRELKEETGTDQATILAESPKWLSYDLPDGLIPHIWSGKYRGQTQKWFLMQFNGLDSDINIHTPEPEFSEWKWAKAPTLPDLIVPFKQQLYKDVLAAFHRYF